MKRLFLLALTGTLGLAACDNQPVGLAAPEEPSFSYYSSTVPEVGCNNELAYRSQFGVTTATIRFANRSIREVRPDGTTYREAVTYNIYWLNYKGERVLYKVLAPGEQVVQQTFLTHPWLVTRARDGSCVGIFLPTTEDGVVILADIRPNRGM